MTNETLVMQDMLRMAEEQKLAERLEDLAEEMQQLAMTAAEVSLVLEAAGLIRSQLRGAR